MAPSPRLRMPALVALLLAVAVLAPPPAAAEYVDTNFSKETIYTASNGDFGYRDATLALRPDGSYVEVFLTPDDDATYPLTLLARTGGPGSWGPVEVVTDDEDDTTPYTIDAFATPDGSVVAVWMVYLEGQRVLRSSTRAPGGGWSEPEVVAAGQLGLRRLVPQPAGATMAWTTDDGVLHSRTWADGGWQPAIDATGTFPTSYEEQWTWADRESDGQLTVAVARDETLYLSQLEPGGTWSEQMRSHEKYSHCEFDVGILDEDGNQAAVATLCYQSLVTGYPGLAYGENGDLHVWWNSWSGMNRIQGYYPNHQIVCDCSPGVSGGVAPGGDLAPFAGVATLTAGDALLPGMPRSVDRRSFHKVWDEDGDLTMFVGGLGDYGRTINVYREGGTFGAPVATFQAPGSSQSSRSGYVVDTFVSGDDILIAYQHSAPASNLGPGGSCNTRILHADNTLTEPLGACLDGNTDDTTAVQAPDGSVAIASASVRDYYFSRLLTAEPSEPEPVAPAIGLGGAAPTYGTAGSALATVTGDGVPATGTVRLRYGATVLATAPLAADGTALLPIGRTALPPGSRTLVVDYLGSDAVLAGSASRTLTVGKATPKAPSVAITKKPTSKKPGKVRVSVAAPTAGLAVPSGPVTVVLRKGGQTRTKAGTLAGGTVTIAVPKLKKGTWKLIATYGGDVHYRVRSAPTVNLLVMG